MSRTRYTLSAHLQHVSPMSPSSPISLTPSVAFPSTCHRAPSEETGVEQVGSWWWNMTRWFVDSLLLELLEKESPQTCTGKMRQMGEDSFFFFPPHCITSTCTIHSGLGSWLGGGGETRCFFYQGRNIHFTFCLCSFKRPKVLKSIIPCSGVNSSHFL